MNKLAQSTGPSSSRVKLTTERPDLTFKSIVAPFARAGASDFHARASVATLFLKWHSNNERDDDPMTMTRIMLLSLGLTSVLRADRPDSLVQHLESVTASRLSVYGLTDNQGRGMDCLKVFQASGANQAGVYYGVYHNRENSVFAVHLARSNNLTHWEWVTRLDTHASQATVWPCENGGYVLAYEKDGENSCWIRVRYYDDLSSLRTANDVKEFNVPRSLAPTAEGTPSFDHVEIGRGGIAESEIHLRFHYFKNVHVDQLAHGKLMNFSAWKAEPLERANAELTRLGWLGNLGDRDKFQWRDSSYYLQEIQRRKGDWSSWRTCLCDPSGMPIHTLNIRTHHHSKAFANPNATWVTDSENQRKLVVTLFLPAEGNPRSEAGTLLYVIRPSKQSQVRD